MLHEQTIQTLNDLRLFGMAKSFSERLLHPAQADLTHAEFLGLLVQDEKTYRDNRRLQNLLKGAKLRHPACLEDIDYRHPRGLNKQVILELANTQWLQRHRQVLITGASGLGKSFIACALGNLAARHGYSVQYWRASRLFESLQQARGDGSHLATLARLAKVQCLIIDDFLLTPLTELERRDLFEIVEDRYGVCSIILTSQYPSKDWHPLLQDPTLADAICDRILHNAYKIELAKADSIRKLQAESEGNSGGPNT